MNEPYAGPSRIRRGKGGKRLWILSGGLIALLVVNVVVGFNPRILDGDEGASLPLDPCITVQAVLEFLDGKAVPSIGSGDATGKGIETIMLRKERISSLKIRNDGSGSILVRFSLDHKGEQYLVECSFVFTTIDAPELHYHQWGVFGGRIVSRR
jgi:hypothetical protein